MRRSYVIAIAGISAALAYIAIILSFYVDIMSLSFNAIAAICIMLPLTQNSYKGALFAYISSGALAMLTVGVMGSLLFVALFGPFTIIAYGLDFGLYDRFRMKKSVRIVVIEIIKIIFFAVDFVILYFVMGLFVNVEEITKTIPLWAFVVCGFIAFVLYDILMHYVFINLRYIVNNRILRRNVPVERKDRKSKKDASHDNNESTETDGNKSENSKTDNGDDIFSKND